MNPANAHAVHRTDEGIWSGKARAEALKVLRRLAKLGVEVIDTADSYASHRDVRTPIISGAPPWR